MNVVKIESTQNSAEQESLNDGQDSCKILVENPTLGFCV